MCKTTQLMWNLWLKLCMDFIKYSYIVTKKKGKDEKWKGEFSRPFNCSCNQSQLCAKASNKCNLWLKLCMDFNKYSFIVTKKEGKDEKWKGEFSISCSYSCSKSP